MLYAYKKNFLFGWEDSVRHWIEAVSAFFSPIPSENKGEKVSRESAFVSKAAIYMLENQNGYVQKAHIIR